MTRDGEPFLLRNSSPAPSWPAYVISVTEAIANELRHSGVTVTCFCPGATDTTQNWLGRSATRFAPRKLVTALSGWVSEKAE
jgi:short-subunit dehydrogenase